MAVTVIEKDFGYIFSLNEFIRKEEIKKEDIISISKCQIDDPAFRQFFLTLFYYSE